jgi:hypothetical protein
MCILSGVFPQKQFFGEGDSTFLSVLAFVISVFMFYSTVKNQRVSVRHQDAHSVGAELAAARCGDESGTLCVGDCVMVFRRDWREGGGK